MWNQTQVLLTISISRSPSPYHCETFSRRQMVCPESAIAVKVGSRIALVSFDGGEIIKTLDVKLEDHNLLKKRNLQWTRDGRGIYFIALNDGVSNIWRQPIDGSAPVQVTNFTTDRIFNFAFSPDDSQLALSRGTLNSDVVMIENAR